jgi:hypothetical protein
VPSHPFSECLDNQLAGDTYVYLYVGNLIPQGLMPYRDAFDHKGPLLYLMMALGIQIGNVAGVWILQTVLLFVSAVYAYKTSRLLVSRAASALAAALAVMWYSLGETGPDTFSVPFLLISLYAFVRYLLNGYRISDWETFLTGLCFGAVALLKINLVSLWIVFVSVVIVVSIAKKEYLLLFRRTFLFLLGAAVVVVPIFYWLWSKGVFADFIECYWNFNLLHYGGMPRPSNYLMYVCPLFFQADMKTLVRWCFYFWFTAPAFLVYLILFLREKTRVRKSLYALMAVYLLTAVLLIGAKSRVFIYYCFPLTAAYLVFFAISFDFLLRLITKHALVASALLLLLIVPVLRTLCPPVVGDWGKRHLIAKCCPDVDVEDLGIPIRFDRSALELAQWLRENTEADALINGIGFHVYWYAKRRCVSPYAILSVRKSYEHTFIRDEEGKFPEYIFLRRREDQRIGRLMDPRHRKETTLESTPEIEKRLADDYEKVYQNDAFDLYRLKER